MRHLLPLLLALALLAALTPAAHAIRVASLAPSVSDSPAERLARVAPDLEEYDPATRCSRSPKPGMIAFVAWLGRTSAGSSWGTFRCELWGEGDASLHAEGRAVDWHLDARDPAQRRAGKRLVALLLGPDSLGTPPRPGPPHGRAGAHMGLLLLERRHQRLRALLAVLREVRRAAQARRPDRRAHGSHPHRPVEGRGGEADELVATGRVRRTPAAQAIITLIASRSAIAR